MLYKLTFSLLFFKTKKPYFDFIYLFIMLFKQFLYYPALFILKLQVVIFHIPIYSITKNKE